MLLFRLNEGFANFYERLVSNLVWPDDRHMDLFVLNSVQGSFEVDSHPDVRPMTNYVETPEDILDQFDTIAYGKCKKIFDLSRSSI